MTRTPISLQDLRRRLYAKAKAESSCCFWGLYVHVCKLENLREAYILAKANDGAPGVDGVTFADIEADGREGFLEQIRDELAARTYRPMRNRRKEIPKACGKVRALGIPTIRDRVVQGALRLILEPIFEADFRPGAERLGELLLPRELGPMLHVHQGLGGEESAAHLMRNSKRKGLGWNRWSRRWLYSGLGLFDAYRVVRGQPQQKALPV